MTISLKPNNSPPEKLQPTGWLRYLSFSLDHKVIGLQYLVCGFLFYLIGGSLAGAIRVELISPLSDFMPREVYNQVTRSTAADLISWSTISNAISPVSG